MNWTRGFSDFGSSQIETFSVSITSLYLPSIKENAPNWS